MRIALYQPDIPQNTGAIMRLCACMDVALDIIEPCGFVLDDKKLSRAVMDYADLMDRTRHQSWDSFLAQKPENSRIVLMTTKGNVEYQDFSFQENDILLAGSESSGVPENIHKMADACITIPMKNNARSLNIALATSMILGEALRQIAKQ